MLSRSAFQAFRSSNGVRNVIMPRVPLSASLFTSKQSSLVAIPPLRGNNGNQAGAPPVYESSGLFVAVFFLSSFAGVFYVAHRAKEFKEPDYDPIRKAIAAKLADPKWDDGSWGPVLVRLGWHAAGTYEHKTLSGGSDGGLIRLDPQASWGANKGLEHARAFLEPIKKQFPDISYADLYSLASVVAIKEMGGPEVYWRPGRTDDHNSERSPPDGRLPNASLGAKHLRDIFGRMGFEDKYIVALSGAHALGRCHPNRSGYTGPWTKAPTMFSNDFFRELLENKWTPKKWNGPLQYEDPSGELMMLPSDLALIQDPVFKSYVEKYAQDEELFFTDFAIAYSMMQEFGVKFKSARK
eukprot:TRINITY_DN637_c0_g1_i1.p1 TRINITY_DN637_c0_g1~~TRINITY_DN637_c0_g1_i1.p1  ORF type:complete len:353 (-),score=42.28 TRINITY_DN637_c0_g1_i1:132-1190(-)